DLEKRKAEKELQRAESLLYVVQTNKAQAHLLERDFVSCRHTLDECRWDLRGPEYGYLADQLAKKVRSLDFSGVGATSLALTRDGKRLYCADYRAIKAFDPQTGKETMHLGVHRGATSLALSEDSKRLFSGGGDNRIKVWDVEQGKEVQTLQGHEKIV